LDYLLSINNFLDLSAEFRIPGPVLGKDKESQPLSITQRYIFTNYSNSPSHEPSGILTVARLYPLLKFSYKGAPSEPKLPTFVRVDYRIESSIEMGLVIGPYPQYLYKSRPIVSRNPDVKTGRERYGLKSPSSTKKLHLQQAGVFKDRDVAPGTIGVIAKTVGTASLRSALTDIFEAAEKPLPIEMIGKGISDNNTADWDNIHTSYVNLFVYFGGIPSTPDC
jgi:hypothetical protein